jgi:ubiquinone/menaquinone biosynthesis C-methylase UbiE
MIRFKFYQNQILKFLNKDKSILVLGASSDEAYLFHKSQFKKITLSNINLAQLKGAEKYNFKKIKIDFRNLYKIKNNSYDYVVVHASIHHTSKPHNILLEMYRIAKLGVLILESNDSFIMRLAVKLNFSEDFEKSALNYKTYVGGVDGSHIPNYVYRWTEREIKKLFYSYQPDKKINIIFNYQNNIYNENLSDNFLKKIIIVISYVFLKTIFILFPKQQNLMSIYIDKKNFKKRTN